MNIENSHGVRTTLRQSTRMQVLTEQQCRDIYHTALRVLERTGCEVLHPQAVEILKEAGARVEGTRVWIPGWLVEKARITAPHQITLYDTEGNPAVVADARSGRSNWACGPTALNIIDRHTHERREVTYQDTYEAGLVLNALDGFDIASGHGLISDREPQIAELYEVRALLETTTKPVTITQFSTENLKAQIEMFSTVCGSEENFIAHPCAIFNAPPITPLCHPEDVLDRFLYMVEKGVPSSYAVTTMVGGTSPATIAGSMVVGLADTFVGLVLSQVINPGCPFIASTGCVPFDMRTMSPALTGPDASLGAAANADLFRYIDLPYEVYLGGSDSPIFDQQAAGDMAMGLITGTTAGCTFNMFAGFLESGMCVALESLIYCDEIIRETRHFTGGIEVSDETLAEDVIDDVGPMNQFLGEEHTMDHYKEMWTPKHFVRTSYEQWNKKNLQERCIEKVDEIVAAGPKRKLSPEILAKLDAIVEEREKDGSGQCLLDEADLFLYVCIPAHSGAGKPCQRRYC